MRYAAVIIFTLALAACTPSEDEHAREQARQTADQAKRDAKKALHEAEDAEHKVSTEVDKDLGKAREKTRKALQLPDDKNGK